MSAADEKKTLRKGLMAKKLALTKDEVAKLSGLIADKLINYADWQNAKNIHIYLPIEKNNEVDTRPTVKFLQKNHPAIKIEIAPQKTEVEIPAGDNYDLIIVPVLGFDRRGFRLGYGGGYYDKFLASNNCRKIIGISYGFAEVDKIPDESFDQKMQTIITDKEIISVS